MKKTIEIRFNYSINFFLFLFFHRFFAFVMFRTRMGHVLQSLYFVVWSILPHFPHSIDFSCQLSVIEGQREEPSEEQDFSSHFKPICAAIYNDLFEQVQQKRNRFAMPSKHKNNDGLFNSIWGRDKWNQILFRRRPGN